MTGGMPPRRVVRCLPTNTGPYRYLLEVALAEDPASRLAVILKNPSTADANRSDPTIGKVEAWARRRGFTSVAVVNLFAFRSPTPTALNALPYELAVGQENDSAIRTALAAAEVAIAAWGNPNGIAPATYARRIAEVLALARGVPLHRVGPLTCLGHPRHGLLWNDGAAPCGFSPDSLSLSS